MLPFWQQVSFKKIKLYSILLTCKCCCWIMFLLWCACCSHSAKSFHSGLFDPVLLVRGFIFSALHLFFNCYFSIFTIYFLYLFGWYFVDFLRIFTWLVAWVCISVILALQWKRKKISICKIRVFCPSFRSESTWGGPVAQTMNFLQVIFILKTYVFWSNFNLLMLKLFSFRISMTPKLSLLLPWARVQMPIRLMRDTKLTNGILNNSQSFHTFFWIRCPASGPATWKLTEALFKPINGNIGGGTTLTVCFSITGIILTYIVLISLYF